MSNIEIFSIKDNSFSMLMHKVRGYFCTCVDCIWYRPGQKLQFGRLGVHVNAIRSPKKFCSVPLGSPAGFQQLLFRMKVPDTSFMYHASVKRSGSKWSHSPDPEEFPISAAMTRDMHGEAARMSGPNQPVQIEKG